MRLLDVYELYGSENMMICGEDGWLGNNEILQLKIEGEELVVVCDNVVNTSMSKRTVAVMDVLCVLGEKEFDLNEEFLVTGGIGDLVLKKEVKTTRYKFHDISYLAYGSRVVEKLSVENGVLQVWIAGDWLRDWLMRG